MRLILTQLLILLPKLLTESLKLIQEYRLLRVKLMAGDIDDAYKSTPQSEKPKKGPKGSESAIS